MSVGRNPNDPKYGMRKFINLVEKSNPSALRGYFLSDAFVDEIVSNGRWSHHGSYLDSFVDDFCDGDDDDEAVRAALIKWLPTRLDHIMNELSSSGPDTVINRIISVDLPTYEEIIGMGEFRIGLYWGAGDFEPQNSNPINMDFVSTLGGVTVDWHQTVLSRIDYDNGDHEQEFQLVDGSPIAITDIMVWEDGNYESVEHLHDFTKKAVFRA